ncbi:MAG: DUF5719 family protein, partial [Acidimicrobiia bacterium]|nr:DUF5719 family protein [Acidimicrobiia bacterium]
PQPPQPPAAVAPPRAEVSTPAAGVWYCPWVQSSFERDGSLALVASSNVSAGLTFPNPEPGGQADTLSLDLVGPGATLVSVADVALRGDIPGFVEFSDLSTAAGVIVESPLTLVAEACIASVPKVWYLVGGSTRQGESLTLRLFNPFPEIAKVSIAAASEFGAEPVTSLDGLSVGPRTWTDVDLAATLRLRDVLAITITPEEGIVIPAMFAATADDEAMWVGSGVGTRWEFPVIGAGSLAGSISLYNPSTEPVLVEIDLMTAEGPIIGAEVVQVGPGEPVIVDLSTSVGGSFGAVVRAEGAVAAAALASGGGGLAATIGAAAPAERWLLPGAGAAGDGVRSVWLSNSGDEPATISLRALGVDGAGAVEKVLVPPGSLRQFIIEPAAGYVAESLTPFVASWAAQGPEAAAFSLGVPMPEA